MPAFQLRAMKFRYESDRGHDRLDRFVVRGKIQQDYLPVVHRPDSTPLSQSIISHHLAFPGGSSLTAEKNLGSLHCNNALSEGYQRIKPREHSFVVEHSA
jgi:hypothetical protein